MNNRICAYNKKNKGILSVKTRLSPAKVRRRLTVCKGAGLPRTGQQDAQLCNLVSCSQSLMWVRKAAKNFSIKGPAFESLMPGATNAFLRSLPVATRCQAPTCAGLPRTGQQDAQLCTPVSCSQSFVWVRKASALCDAATGSISPRLSGAIAILPNSAVVPTSTVNV